VDRTTLALGLAFFAHAAGVVLLLALALRGEGSSWRDWWPRDDDGGGGDPPPAVPPAPLPGAEPARTRLRTEHDGVVRPRVRRPAHAPEREPRRVSRPSP
jgi:hypothetical protein